MSPGRKPKKLREMGRACRLVLGALLVGGWTPAGAQVVAVGLVTENIFGRAVGNVLITLSEVGGEGDPVVVTTDRAGRFAALLPGPGRYEVTVRHLAYTPLTWGPIKATEAEEVIELLIELQPHVRPLEELSVEVEREPPRVPALELNGFYRRERRGFGSFIPPEVFDNYRHSLALALRGVHLPRVCQPTILVDGVVMNGELGEVVSAISLQNILAMEVYPRVSSVPAEYQFAVRNCGIILVWTRR